MYERILIVVSERAPSQAAVKEGVALAKVHGSAVLFFKVLPRYVVPDGTFAPLTAVAMSDFEHDARIEATRLLDAATAIAKRAGVDSATAMDTGLDDATCIADAARDHRCSLIVVGTGGRNAVMRLLAGSVIPGLITRATVPILICRKPEGPSATKAEPGRKASTAPPRSKKSARKRTQAAGRS